MPRRICRTVVGLVAFSVCLAAGVARAQTISGAGANWDVSNVGGTTNGMPTGVCDFATPGLAIRDANLDTGPTDAFDFGLVLYLNNQIFVAPALSTTASSGSSGVGTLAGLNVSVRYDALSTSPTLRALVSLNNPTGSPIAITAQWLTNVGSDSSTQVVTTSSGDTTFTPADRWIITDDILIGFDPTNTHVLFGPGGPPVTPTGAGLTVFTCAGTEGVLSTFSVTVAPGTTSSLLFFNRMNDTAADAQAAAPDFDVPLDPANPLFAGLTSPELLSIVNWVPAAPALTLTKEVSATAVGPWASSVTVLTGSAVYYQFTITNTGNVPLSPVSVTDPDVSTAGCVWTDPLPPAGVTTCVVGPIAALAGLHTNTATASGTYSGQVHTSDPVSASYFGASPALTLAKTASPATYSADGQTITYTYVVTNTGNVPLDGPIVVTDDRATVTCPPTATLAVNASITCTATYTTTLADVAAKSVTNTATASGSFLGVPVVSPPASATVTFVKAVLGPTQKGSLLIFPDIDVRAGKTTLVRLVNDGDATVYVKCVWQDFYKNKTDFVVPLTPRQAVWFDAATGDGSVAANGFPPGGYLAGELVCFAVTLSEQAIAYNYLAGTATVMDFVTGTAYEYTASGFYHRGDGIRQAGELRLDGLAYDLCPQYLLGQFSPTGTTLTTAGGDALYLQNRLAVASCTQDLRQDFVPVTTKLQFDVWNGHEIKFTGAYECADSWHEVILGGKTLWKGAQPQTFLAASLGTAAAYYRVQGVASPVCNNLPPWNVATQAVGLFGVHSALVDLDGVPVALGTPTSVAGTRVGSIRYDPGFVTPEGRR